MIWLVSLLVVTIAYPYVPPAIWKPLALDVSVFACLIYLFRSNQLARAIEAWYFLRRKSNHIMRRQLSLALASDLLRLISLPFAGMWLWRWVKGFEYVMTTAPTVRQFNHVQAFLFCLLLAYVLDTAKFRRWLYKMHMTSGREVLFQYSAAVITGTFLLLMPFSLNPGKSLAVIDSMFVTVSALSVTGLTPIDVSGTFSRTGMIILLMLIQLGGLGIVLITAGFSIMTFRRLSMNSILLGREMYSTARAGELPDFLTRVITTTLLVEIMGSVAIYLSLPKNMPDRLFFSVFHAVSAFCNAGFSTASTGLLDTPLYIPGMVTICMLIILGGLGFPIMFDLWNSIVRRERSVYLLTPHAKLTLLVMAVLLVLGPTLFFLLESLRPSADITLGHKIANSVFYSISARTAGFNMFLIDSFNTSALFWLILLMAIGANPSSTGGGIKTTTIGVIYAAVICSIRGFNQTTFAGRAIPIIVISRALTVISLYFFIAGLALIILVTTERAPPFALAFEVVSALSTVGLSMSVTPQLTVVGKLIIMFLMLFGRIGILTFVLAGIGKTRTTKIRYPTDDFFVG